MADEEFNPAAFFDAIRKSVHVKAGAIMFGQAQVAYYDALKEGMPEDQAFNMLAHTTEHVVRGVFSAVGPVCDAILKAAAMAEMFGLSNKPSDKKVPGVNDIVLKEGQKLTEQWEVEYTGRGYRTASDKRVECRIVKMYHGTIYGGANGYGKTVDESRLNAVLGLARAICDDPTAFNYDADEIMKAEMLRWWQSRIKEEQEALELLDCDDPPKQRKRIKRRINLLEQLQGEWQEEHDYWPEEATASPGTAGAPAPAAAHAAVSVSAAGVADGR